jgi:CMP-N-acetylneuraminic acid synthetase
MNVVNMSAINPPNAASVAAASALSTANSRPLSWTGLIPLRAGSKGLPGKNIRLLAGKPLFQYSLDAAYAAGATHCVISSDIDSILNLPQTANLTTLRRPTALQGDTVDMAAVLLDTILRGQLTGTMVLLQATSPLRTAAHIRAGLEVFASGNYELVMSVTQAQRSVLKWGMLDQGRFKPLAEPAYCFSNRQQLPELVRPNGALYIFDAQWFVRNQGFVTDQIGAIEMSENDSLDIDTLDDFERCEQQLLHQTPIS